MTAHTTTVICLILVAHWVGDFVWQSQAMAVNKSKSNQWLTYHVIVYTIVLLVFFTHPWFGLINGAIHWCVDWQTSRWNAKLWQKAERTGNYHDFFVMVGLDQLAHGITLVLTAYYLL